MITLNFKIFVVVVTFSFFKFKSLNSFVKKITDQKTMIFFFSGTLQPIFWPSFDLENNFPTKFIILRFLELCVKLNLFHGYSHSLL